MSKVNDKSAAVEAMEEDWAKMDALIGGTKAMRAAGEKYLPRFPAESKDAYDFRVKTSTLYNATGRTVENMAAKPFAEATTVRDIDGDSEKWLENIDLCGNNVTVFAHKLFLAGLGYGLAHVLVDMPSTVDDDGKQLYPTKAAEQSAGVRPYLVLISPKQILGWRSARGPDGQEALSMLRFMESVDEDDGEFGTKTIPQIRVLTPSTWATYRKAEKPAAGQATEDWVPHKQGPVSLGKVPLVTFYTKRTGFMTATPPLIDMADLNIKHWQSSSDQDSILHTARVPLLAISGLQDDDNIEIGPKAFLRLPVGGEAKYVEHTGAAIEAGRMSLQDLENQMRAMGAELLAETQVATTATQNNIEDSEAKSQLKLMVEGEEDALDNAITLMHEWVGREFSGKTDIFKDFSSDAVLVTAGPFVAALIDLVETGMLSKEDAFNEMRRYGIVNPDLVWKDVKARIAADPPAPPKAPDVVVP
ncbi:DUF4055 domain-containing protein [Duganella sp. FT80W]|uniref:DUF4055 domain-containing protein n=1 Tax=Duganella guangzhouensis TaxID=2666084 RepID=A0A6I2KUT9_9BURK|nr:DUF4055 domain-containing protein [Duganella guangzhouensis]MRW88857.1 DUF4055 domain-containing protein [Duganella guangzhouensis]